MTHTPNRLAVYENTLAGYGDNGRNFFLVPEGSYGNENAIAELTLEHQLLNEGETKRYLTAKSNARRLVACWNACAGIPTEELEQGSVKLALDVLSKF